MAMNMDASLRLNAKVDGLNNIVALNRGLLSVENTAKGVTGAMRGMTGAAAGLSGALGSLVPLLSVAGLAGMVQNTVKAGDAMYDLSQRTGVTVESLAKFKKAAATSGTDIEGVSKSLVKLSKTMLDAGSGSANAVKTFAALGISITGTNGQMKSADAVMLEVADRFKTMPDGVAKTALALRLFGKSGDEMIPMLNMGGDAIDKLSVKMTTAFAQKMDAYSDRLAVLSGKVGALGMDLTVALLPALEGITTAVTQAVTAFNALPDGLKAGTVSAAALALAWGPLTGLIKGGVGIVAQLANGLEILRYQTALAGGTMPLLAGGLQAVRAAILAIPGWGWALAGVTALAALTKALYDNNKDFRNWVNGVGTVVNSDFQGAMRNLVRYAKSGIDAVKGQLNSLQPATKTTASGLNTMFGNAFQSIANNSVGMMRAIGMGIQQLWAMIPAPLRNMLSSQAKGTGLGLFSSIGGYLSSVNQRAGKVKPVTKPTGGGGGGSGSVTGGFIPDLSALDGGSSSKDKKERESQLDQINEANGLFRSQAILNERIAIAEYEQNTAEKLRLQYIERGVKLLAEAAAIRRDKIPQNQKDARLRGVDDQLLESTRQYNRDIFLYQKQAIDSLPSYLSGLQSVAAGYGAVLDYSKRFTAEQERQKQLGDGIANTIGQGMASAFDSLIAGSENFGASLRKIASGVLIDIAKQLLQIFVINQAISAISSIFAPQPALSGVKFNPAAFSMPRLAANGMVAMSGVQPFATGGIFDQPTLFRFANGGAGNLGLLGEAGPEAIMPLKRGANGKLGVAGGGGQTNVTVNVDAKGTSAQGDEGKGNQLARVVAQAVQAELVKQKRPGGILA